MIQSLFRRAAGLFTAVFLLAVPAVALATTNPLAGVQFYVDPSSPAAKQVIAWQTTRPADAAQIAKIAEQPQGIWLAGKTPIPDISAQVNKIMTAAQAQRQTPILILYTIPQRDCGGAAAGGFTNANDYTTWINSIARGINGRRAVVILEPDALDNLGCLSAADQQTRYSLLRNAVQTLKSTGNVTLYIDAGNPGWKQPPMMATRLKTAGIDQADGFALNISNYFTTADNIKFGTALSQLLDGKHFVIDTSRNGLGPAPDGKWSTQIGRALGNPVSTETGNPLVDAYLWLNPGYNDGQCAKAWCPEAALGLAQRSPFDFTSATVAPSPSVGDTYHAQWVSQNAYPTLRVGQSYQFEVNIRNTGTATWTRGIVNLGTDRGRDRIPEFVRDDVVGHSASGWISPNRVELVQSQVAPGETGTFRFWMSVPGDRVAGVYREYFRPVADGITWLDDWGIYWDVTVIR